MGRRARAPLACLDCRLTRPGLCETCQAVRAANEIARREERLAYQKAYREAMPAMQRQRYKATRQAKERSMKEAAQC